MRTLLLLGLLALLAPAANAARVNIPKKDMDLAAQLPVRTGGFASNRGPYRVSFRSPTPKTVAEVSMSRTWRAGKGGNVEFTWTLTRSVDGQEHRTLTARGIRANAKKQ